eukprot:3251568-Prymnesium_polylepis.1
MATPPWRQPLGELSDNVVWGTPGATPLRTPTQSSATPLRTPTQSSEPCTPFSAAERRARASQAVREWRRANPERSQEQNRRADANRAGSQQRRQRNNED